MIYLLSNVSALVNAKWYLGKSAQVPSIAY